MGTHAQLLAIRKDLNASVDAEHGGVSRGNLTRRLDDSFEYIFNGCSTVIVLVLTGPLLILTLPLYLYCVAVVLQQQAFQAAMLDYFAETGFDPKMDCG